MKKDFIVIGSTAMSHHYPDFTRQPTDIDIVIRTDDFHRIFQLDDNSGNIEKYQAGVKGQSFIIKYKNCPEPFEYLLADFSKSLELILDQLGDESDYAQPQVLYSLKKAHIHFPIKFQKHIKDYMFLRQKLREKRGITLEQDLNAIGDLLDGFPALTDLHFRETEKRLGKLKTPKMNQSTENFFGKSKKFVKSYYVHDDMHKAIADMHSGTPVYQKIQAEGKEVETDLILWSQLTIQEKIWCVLEETYVIALERKVLPIMFNTEPEVTDFEVKSAFDWALYRVCTTLCDGFFREFAVRAYDEIQKQYNPDYVENFFKNISKYDNHERTTEKEIEENNKN